MRVIVVVRRIALATTLVTLGMLPVFLVSSLSVLMGADLQLSESRVGMAIGVNFLVATVLSLPAGRLTQRYGVRAGFTLGALGTTLGLISVASARSWGAVLVGMACAGAATAFLQVAANLSISRDVPSERLGVAYSIKQSAIPFATLVAGIAVPVVTRMLPWRAAFLAAAIVVGLVWIVQRAVHVAPTAVVVSTAQRSPVAVLVVLAVGIGAASAAATSTAAFLVPFLVSIDVAARTAGTALAVCSVVTIIGRILIGLARDRFELDGLVVVILQVLLGAGALLVLAVPGLGVSTLAGAVLLAFAAGWTWSGIFTDAVVRTAPAAAASSTGLTQTGVYLGAGAGPILFGLLAETQGYAAAWRSAAVLFLLSAVLIAFGRGVLGGPAGGRRSTREADGAAAHRQVVGG